MSFDFNYKFWVATSLDLKAVIKRQNFLKRMEPIEDPQKTYRLLSELYVLYSELAKKLGYCYMHTYQVQKRPIVRKLVESATRRLMELKLELQTMQLCEYIYVDNVYIRRKLNPYDMVIWRSPDFIYRRSVNIENIMYQNRVTMTDTARKLADEEEHHIYVKTAIIIIQAHERARQSRVYLSTIRYDKKLMRPIRAKRVVYTYNHKPNQIMSIPVKRTIFGAQFLRPTEECKRLLDPDELDVPVEEEEDPVLKHNRLTAAAIKIQKFWRGYRTRKMYKQKIRYREKIYKTTCRKVLKPPRTRLDDVIDMYKREKLKDELSEEFIKIMQSERTRLLQQRSPWVMEDISDHIRAWFKMFYDKTGDFHPYPDALKSGTVLVLLDETMSTIEFAEKLLEKNLSKEEKKKRAEKAKAAKKKERLKIRKEKMKEIKRLKKLKDKGIYDIEYFIRKNKHIKQIEDTMRQYSIDWKLVDEYLNKEHAAIKEWITDDEMAIIHRELHALVDEFMRLEYERLREAHCIDNKKKYKPPKPKKPKKEKKKKGKKRKSKDLTPDRSLESLYNELKDQNIIQSYKEKYFEGFWGDFNYLADDYRDEDKLTILDPAKGDIKSAIQDCIFGFGEFQMDRPKSICIVAPMQSGKELLCNIMASELDALLINLSPEFTYTWQPEELAYKLHVIIKVARAFQPTVIYIDGCHRIFWKKIPPDQAYLNPKLLGTLLQKRLLKAIGKEERILILGTSDQPWTAAPAMKKAFQKILMIPSTSDYGSSFMVWLNCMRQAGGDEEADPLMEDGAVSALAKTLINYTSGTMCTTVDNTLTVQRRMHLKTLPFSPTEFLEYLLEGKADPVFPLELKIVQKFNKWYSAANKFCKLRKQFLKIKAAKAKKK